MAVDNPLPLTSKHVKNCNTHIPENRFDILRAMWSGSNGSFALTVGDFFVLYVDLKLWRGWRIENRVD